MLSKAFIKYLQIQTNITNIYWHTRPITLSQILTNGFIIDVIYIFQWVKTNHLIIYYNNILVMSISCKSFPPLICRFLCPSCLNCSSVPLIPGTILKYWQHAHMSQLQAQSQLKQKLFTSFIESCRHMSQLIEALGLPLRLGLSWCPWGHFTRDSASSMCLVEDEEELQTDWLSWVPRNLSLCCSSTCSLSRRWMVLSSSRSYYWSSCYFCIYWAVCWAWDAPTFEARTSWNWSFWSASWPFSEERFKSFYSLCSSYSAISACLCYILILSFSILSMHSAFQHSSFGFMCSHV
ncbi:hypothetical protein FGO68_gene886 [Halteria grandinella]|uniref:Uncharacterized protein n=1 Tax=Halteria grandinella TaxID=5974 RepID=A0A8J8P199_HALGN|nr:hypothetical protein FGO68_gene886 [Halteria grandinella]